MNTAEIIIKNGQVIEVHGLPRGYDFIVHDCTVDEKKGELIKK